MSPYKCYYSHNVGLADLTEKTFRILPLSRESVREHLGGATLNTHLFRQYEEKDPLILGTGPLTGSFAPASCLLVATFKPAGDSKPVHVPLTLRTGPEMKFCRLDFLVLYGRSSSPALLKIRSGDGNFADGAAVHGKNLTEAHRFLIQAGEYRSSLLAGRAGGLGVARAAAQVGLSGSWDKAGLALWMGQRNLEGILFQGTDGLFFGEDHETLSLELGKRIRLKEGKSEGFRTLLKKTGWDDPGREVFRGTGQKVMACYHCLFPCMTWLSFSNRHFVSGREKTQREVLWLTDPAGFMALKEKRPADILPLFRACREFGLDPRSVAPALDEGNPYSDTLVRLENLLLENHRESPPVQEEVSHPFLSGMPSPAFPGMEEKRAALAEKKMAAAMVLGICPLFLLLAPSVDVSDYLKFLPGEKGAADFYREKVENLSERLIRENLAS